MLLFQTNNPDHIIKVNLNHYRVDLIFFFLSNKGFDIVVPKIHRPIYRHIILIDFFYNIKLMLVMHIFGIP